jgi:hypothetical protein
MAITILPRQKSALEYMEPYLQMAMQKMLQNKMREENLLEARKLNPELFTETTPLSTYQKFLPQGTELNLPSGITPEQQSQYANQLTAKKGITIPEQYRTFTFNKEKLGQPTINVATGEVSYKPKDASDLYYEEAARVLKNSNNNQTDTIKIPKGEHQEDWYLKPEMRSMRGVPTQVEIPTRKNQVPREDLALIKDLDVNISDLQSNLKFLEDNPKIKEFLGPGLAQRPGTIADIVTQMGFAPKDWATFKSKTDLAFQKYRKWVTGVQAGYPELQWIVVDYPKPTDTFENYASKALSAMEGMARNKEIYLDYLSKNNYAVGKLRDNQLEKDREVTPQGQEDLSNLSDEELRKIAAGG